MARGPVRLKNLQLRFLPFAFVALAGLLWIEPRSATLAIGAGCGVVGLGLRSWGAGHLVKTHELICTGPYAHLRHPLYVGSLACALGFAIAVAGWIGAAMAVGFAIWFACAYLPRKEAWESHRLEAAYGAAFVRYRAAVPAFWPRVEAWRPAEDPPDALRELADRQPEAPGDGRRQRPAAAPGWQLERWLANNELGTLLAITAAFAAVALRAAWIA